jgi:hypothetical protein
VVVVVAGSADVVVARTVDVAGSVVVVAAMVVVDDAVVAASTAVVVAGAVELVTASELHADPNESATNDAHVHHDRRIMRQLGVMTTPRSP